MGIGTNERSKKNHIMKCRKKQNRILMRLD